MLSNILTFIKKVFDGLSFSNKKSVGNIINVKQKNLDINGNFSQEIDSESERDKFDK